MANSRKFTKNKEWLIQEYVINDRPRKEIAAKCGLTEAGLKSVLTQLDVKKEKFTINKNTLIDLVNAKLSADEIAEKLECYNTTVYRYLKKYNLKILAEPKKHEQYNSVNDSQICAYYMNGLSSKEIAKIFKTSHNTILAHLKHCKIPIKTLSEAQWNYNKKEFPKDLQNYNKVYEMYVNQKLSKRDLGNKYNCDPGVIDRILKDFNIYIRNSSESKIGQMIGEKHPNWQGGITGLHMRLREAFHVQQVPQVLKRDNYTCQICGSHKYLQVHHKKLFSDIFHRILNEHPDLDPIENQNELYNIALKDIEFNNLNNLITYCKECHLFKVHGYKYRKI